jgi:hypothetical protein
MVREWYTPRRSLTPLKTTRRIADGAHARTLLRDLPFLLFKYWIVDDWPETRQ